MIKISILRDSQVTNQGTFPTMEEAQAWLDKHDAMGTFGQKAQVIEQQVEIAPAVIDAEGNEIVAAQFEMQQISIPGYEVVMEDLSAQMLQEKINAEALAYLASTDWLIIRELDSGEVCPAEVKAERAACRARIVR